MEIKDFVKKVLTDLVSAVEETRKESVRDMSLTDNKDQRTIEFDIAVSVEEESSASGKAGIKVLQFAEAGGNLSKEIKNSTVSRVKFGIRVDSMTKSEEAVQRAQLDSMNAHVNYD